MEGNVFIFKIEMREKYGHVEEDSDNEEEIENIMEKEEEVEENGERSQGYPCEQCKFIGKITRRTTGAKVNKFLTSFKQVLHGNYPIAISR